MADNRSNLSRFAKVPFDIQVQLDRITMRIGDILNLKVGTVITLRKPAGDNFDVLAGGARIASGEVVILDNAMGVRLTGLEGN